MRTVSWLVSVVAGCGVTYLDPLTTPSGVCTELLARQLPPIYCVENRGLQPSQVMVTEFYPAELEARLDVGDHYMIKTLLPPDQDLALSVFAPFHQRDSEVVDGQPFLTWTCAYGPHVQSRQVMLWSNLPAQRAELRLAPPTQLAPPGDYVCIGPPG